MSIGKRLIDLARSELNSLLDKAARVDGDDADERERRRYGSEYGSMSDQELDEEIERRRQAREEVEQATNRNYPAGATRVVGAAAAHGSRRRGDPQGLRGAGGAGRVGSGESSSVRTAGSCASITPTSTQGRRRSSGPRPISRSA